MSKLLRLFVFLLVLIQLACSSSTPPAPNNNNNNNGVAGQGGGNVAPPVPSVDPNAGNPNADPNADNSDPAEIAEKKDLVITKIHEGKRLQALKALREATNKSLRELSDRLAQLPYTILQCVSGDVYNPLVEAIKLSDSMNFEMMDCNAGPANVANNQAAVANNNDVEFNRGNTNLILDQITPRHQPATVDLLAQVMDIENNIAGELIDGLVNNGEKIVVLACEAQDVINVTKLKFENLKAHLTTMIDIRCIQNYDITITAYDPARVDALVAALAHIMHTAPDLISRDLLHLDAGHPFLVKGCVSTERKTLISGRLVRLGANISNTPTFQCGQ